MGNGSDNNNGNGNGSKTTTTLPLGILSHNARVRISSDMNNLMREIANSNGVSVSSVIRAMCELVLREAPRERLLLYIAAEKKAVDHAQAFALATMYQSRMQLERRRAGEVLRMKGEGYTIPQIAKELEITSGLVINLLQKYGGKNQASITSNNQSSTGRINH